MYAELHCRTAFSFLRGASHPQEFVERAAELEYAALAITDCASLAGVVRAHGAAKDLDGKIKLLIGAELEPVDCAPLVVWATDRAAYGRLCRLITCGRRRAAKGNCELHLDDLAAHSEGLIAGLLPPDERSPRGNEQEKLLLPDSAAKYREIFAERCYLLAELHHGPDDRGRLQRLLGLARQLDLPAVAAGNVLYHVPERLPLQHALTAIREGTTIHAAGDLLLHNASFHLRRIEELQRIYAPAPQLLRRTLEIAGQCTFSLDELRYEYPVALVPPGETASSFLRRLTWQGGRERYPRGMPAQVRSLVEHELALIEELRYEAYFLTVWDLVRFGRDRGILCQGRGSAANSAVCYCLGITAVDPEKMDVLFERFVSRERNEAPDIDVDFEHERREEVLQYLYDKYGRERTGMTAEVITYRPRSAVRDLGKALGLSLDRVDALAKNLEGYGQEPKLAARCRMSGIDPESRTGRQLISLVEQLVGFPRHLSQHVGGMVMTEGPLCELVPIENAAMAQRTVIEWNKDDLDELGILKVDCLALGMLTAIAKCFALIKKHTGRELTLANVPAEDPQVYAMISRADTMGVFQIESRAQMSMLPRLRPREFYDLVIEVAIVRPGPIQGNMVHPYLRRRNGEEPVTYPTPEIRDVLHKTLGVPLFQEQAMRLAVVAAGFSPGEADQLRRAMGAWRRPGVIDKFRIQLLEGMRARGLPEAFAEHVFSQIRGFGEYGFPESHAASFALLVYVSAWLKRHHPAAFCAALLNSQPMGFYAPAQLVRNAIEHKVEVRPIDINASDWDCTLEEAESSKVKSQIPNTQLALRLGLRMIVGLGRGDAKTIVAARRARPFRSLDDFTRRAGVRPATVERLAAADAFAAFAVNRRGALWQALGCREDPSARPLFADQHDDTPPPAVLPALTEQQQVFADYQTSGLSLRTHPVAFYRQDLAQLNVAAAEDLLHWPEDRQVTVAGLVLMRQRPSTAKGITFVTLEDETGTANLVIRQQVWERYYQIARGASALIARGSLERKHSVVHVVVRQLEDLTQRLESLRTRSRDFR